MARKNRWQRAADAANLARTGTGDPMRPLVLPGEKHKKPKRGAYKGPGIPPPEPVRQVLRPQDREKPPPRAAIPKKQPRRSGRIAKKERKNLNEERLEKEAWGDYYEEVRDKKHQGYNDRLDKSAVNRVDQIVKPPPSKLKKLARQSGKLAPTHPPISRRRRHLLFINPGDEPILEATVALTTGGQMPPWTQWFEDALEIKNGKLHFEGLPVAFKEEKRQAVKELYFDPKEPATIQPITDALRLEYANISKRNVTNILKSIDTYARNFRRRHPTQIMNRMVMNNPGLISFDMFFPSKAIYGWEGRYSCLTCMDCWSRFCRVYALERKNKKTVRKAMVRFMQELSSLGVIIRRCLQDKGTDLAPAYELMEQYRQAKDGDSPMVFNSRTAQPVNIIEALNSQIQRRMAIFRTSNLTDDPSVILDDISEQLNHQRRPDRGNMTPYELLALNAHERQRINAEHKHKTMDIEVKGLPAIHVGSYVRVLLLTRKEQADTKTKGFGPKWSVEVYRVQKKIGLRRNPGRYSYSVGLRHTYLRHELLKVPKEVDRVVPDYLKHHQQVVDEDDYDPEGFDSDDSRYEG